MTLQALASFQHLCYHRRQDSQSKAPPHHCFSFLERSPVRGASGGRLVLSVEELVADGRILPVRWGRRSWR